MSQETVYLCAHTDDKKYTDTEIPKAELQQNFYKKITQSTIRNENALNNRIWREKKIYWRLDSDYEWIDKKTLEKMIRAAFLEASLQTPLVINQMRRKHGDAHLLISFVHSKDEPYFAKKKGVLAFGYGPSGGLGGDITMNADKLWWLGPKLTAKEAFEKGMIENYDRNHPNNTIKTYDPLHTMKHEGGHALGMRHLTETSQRKSEIMYPFYNGLRKFGPNDIAYLQRLYGKSSLSHKILELFRNRIQRF